MRYRTVFWFGLLFVQKYVATLGSTVLPVGSPRVEKGGEAEAVLGEAAPATANNENFPPVHFCISCIPLAPSFHVLSSS